MTDPIWICDCGAINEDHWQTCSECQEYKPRPCDQCGTEFVPWSESSKGNAKIHKYTCRKCYLVSDNLNTTHPTKREPMPDPKPTGNLVVVGAHPPAYWSRDSKIVAATVVVRDEAGNEFSFAAECKATNLAPYYR